MKTSPTKELYIKQARTELTEHIVYGALAKREKNSENRKALERLSAQEKTHYDFWKTLLPQDVDPQPYAFTVFITPLLRAVFGATFTTKLLEGHETNAVANYQHILAAIPATHQERLKQIIEDEKSHELALIGEIKEKRVAYLGFIVLGLADAIVEITGVHAGFLGVTGTPLVAGVAGIIVGFAAAISMGSASYLQAKQDPEKSASLSAIATGGAYLFSVVLLALPYFLIQAMIPAFITSTIVGIVLIAIFTFYGTVVFEGRKFWREFFEAFGLMLGTAVATFAWGVIVGKIFHVNTGSF